MRCRIATTALRGNLQKPAIKSNARRVGLESMPRERALLRAHCAAAGSGATHQVPLMSRRVANSVQRVPFQTSKGSTQSPAANLALQGCGAAQQGLSRTHSARTARLELGLRGQAERPKLSVWTVLAESSATSSERATKRCAWCAQWGLRKPTRAQHSVYLVTLACLPTPRD